MDELEIARIRTIPDRHLDRIEHFVVEFVSPLDEGLFIINAHFGTDVTRTLLAQARELGFPVSDTSYRGDEGREAHGVADSVEGMIGSAEEAIVRPLILLMLWLGYDRFH